MDMDDYLWLLKNDSESLLSKKEVDFQRTEEGWDKTWGVWWLDSEIESDSIVLKVGELTDGGFGKVADVEIGEVSNIESCEAVSMEFGDVAGMDVSSKGWGRTFMEDNITGK